MILSTQQAFGLLGEGTELAEPIQPTSSLAQPVRADEAPATEATDTSEQTEEERSLFDRITFGLFE
jgi:hypothetical protein